MFRMSAKASIASVAKAAVLVGSLALLPTSQANAADMKYCLQYMNSQSNGTTQYYPVNDNGSLDIEALKKMAAKKQARYFLSDKGDQVESNEGSSSVVINVAKKDQLPQTIRVSIGSGFGRPIEQGSGQDRRFRNSTAVHEFRYVDGTCIPDRMQTTVRSETIAGGVSEVIAKEDVFSSKECRALHEFFVKNPALKACGEVGADSAIRLSNILRKAPTMVKNVSEDKAFNDAFFKLKFAYDRCQKIPGLKEALSRNELWPSPASDQISNRPGPKRSVR